MYGDRDLDVLFAFADTLEMVNGWRVIKRAEWTDITPQRPHGLSYALILQDQEGNRLFGFDNSHGFDGSEPQDRYDHEHRPDQVGQRFRYEFVSASGLVNDFFDRLGKYCANRGVSADFL